MKKFLIVKTSALGDIIQTFPVIDYLKDRFPNSEIDWVVESQGADLVQAHPKVSNTICINSKKWRKAVSQGRTWLEIQEFRKSLKRKHYDCIFDLQGNGKSGLITFQAKGQAKVGFGWRSAHEWPNAFFTNFHYNPPPDGNIREDYLSIVQQHFKDSATTPKNEPVLLKISEEQHSLIHGIIDPYKNQKKVLICAGSAWRNKQMNDQSLATFLKLLKDHLKCHFLFAWGSPEEKELALKLHFNTDSQIVPKLPLNVLQNLMANVDLIIAMDSLPLHLAGTTQTPTFSIFGASSAKKYKPQGPQHHSLQGPCPYGRTFEKRCPILRTCTTGLCIRGLTGEAVFDSFIHKITIEH